MKKNILLSILIISSAVLCFGCSSKQTDSSASPQETANSLEEEIASENSISLEGTLDTEQTLEGGTITVPSHLQEEATDQLPVIEETASSITYELNSVQQSELVNHTAASLQNSITEVLSDKKNYPHITKISVNKDCSEFNILFSSHDLTIYETTLRLSLYLAGNKYQLYSGIPEEELLTTVHYADASSGDIFATGTSKELH